MVKEAFNGFCMALADSVPGVSGGTIAFILGFYDRFIGSIHDLFFGDRSKKKVAFRYLIKLGAGWILGMIMAVLLLSALFENHIYTVSSLFIGFVAGSIPLIIIEEKENARQVKKGILFCLLGIALVVGITWANGISGKGSMDLHVFSFITAIKLFFIGMIAISAMFLPGISGSTLLLIFGAYIPVITAVKGVLAMDLSAVPNLCFFGCGIIAGAVTVVKAIKVCLDRFRVQTVYMILGMMIGSIYAIIMGPTTLAAAKSPLSIHNFQWIAMLVGLVLIGGIQLIKEKR